MNSPNQTRCDPTEPCSRPLLTLSAAPSGRIARGLTVLAFALTALVVAVSRAAAQDALLPTVSLVLSVDVRDRQAWFDAYQEILATPRTSPVPLQVTIMSQTPRRAILLIEPRFSATMGGGPQAIRVLVRGKMAGSDALATLQAFMVSLDELSASSTPSTVKLDYGLSSFTGDVAELKTEER